MICELASANHLQVSDEQLSAKAGHVGDFRVLPKGKKFLQMVPSDTVRPAGEVLESVWPRKPSKFHRETVWDGHLL